MPATIKRKPTRKDLPKGANLCEHCTAKCCRYFALPIENPKTRKDYDYIRWYLLHAQATVFVEDNEWYLLVHTVCKHLQDDHRCGIYETRPAICREYTTNKCEYDDEWTYDQYFETPEQVHEFSEALFSSKRGRNIRSSKPPMLPILN